MRKRYILPNLFTAANMILGLISIAFSVEGRYLPAGWLIIWSTIVDKLDGSTARMLKASSEFGVEFDSFSDFIAFGVAPGFLVYSLTRERIAAIATGDSLFVGIAVLIYIVFTALRLARFNVTSSPLHREFFQGLPSTAAGGIVAALVLTCLKYDLQHYDLFPTLMPVVLIFAALFMVSSFRLPKMKRRKRAWMNLVQVGVFLFSLALIVLRRLPEVLLGLAVGVMVWGALYAYLRGDELMVPEQPDGLPGEGEDDGE